MFLDFIAKYWLEVLFTGIVSLITMWVRHDLKLWKESWQAQKEQFKKEIEDEGMENLHKECDKLTDKDKQLDNSLADIELSLKGLTKGLLSVQRNSFYKQCKKLLNPDHIITVDEFEQLADDHEAYNGLGGNHTGDLLFNSVQEKYNSQFK